MNLFISEIQEYQNITIFHCQNENVNEFLIKHALYNNRNLLSKVYILIDRDFDEIAGIFTLSAYRLNLPYNEKYSIQQVPAVLLGRIGVADKYRGQNLAKEYLIRYALGVCDEVKNYIGCRLLIVEVEREDSIKDYLIKNGFQEETSNKKYYFLSIDLLK